MFGVVNTQIEVDQNLCMLQMNDNNWFATHIIHFESYAFKSNWNSAALQSELYYSLPTHIKEAMKTIPWPSLFQELWDLAMQIDQRHWEYEAETWQAQIQWTQPHLDLPYNKVETEIPLQHHDPLPWSVIVLHQSNQQPGTNRIPQWPSNSQIPPHTVNQNPLFIPISENNDERLDYVWGVGSQDIIVQVAPTDEL